MFVFKRRKDPVRSPVDQSESSDFGSGKLRFRNADDKIRAVGISVAIQDQLVFVLLECDLLTVIRPANALNPIRNTAERAESLRAFTEGYVGIANDRKPVYKEVELISCTECKVFVFTENAAGLTLVDGTSRSADPFADAAEQGFLQDILCIFTGTKDTISFGQ